MTNPQPTDSEKARMFDWMMKQTVDLKWFADNDTITLSWDQPANPAAAVAVIHRAAIQEAVRDE